MIIDVYVNGKRAAMDDLSIRLLAIIIVRDMRRYASFDFEKCYREDGRALLIKRTSLSHERRVNARDDTSMPSSLGDSNENTSVLINVRASRLRITLHANARLSYRTCARSGNIFILSLHLSHRVCANDNGNAVIIVNYVARETA